MSMMIVLNGISPSHIISGSMTVGQGVWSIPSEMTRGMPRYWSPTSSRRLKLVKKERTLP